MVLGLCVVPAIGFTIAAIDTRLGFQLLMASLSVMMLVLIIALLLRVRGLRPGAIRIVAVGELRFLPSRGHRVGGIAVPVAMLLPVIILGVVAVCDLPTQASSSRLLALLPMVLLGTSIGSLAMAVWSMRIPLGLRVGATGLAGVRGSRVTNVTWDELERVAPLGAYGSKLVVATRSRGSIVLDAHHLGSDPAIVADVIEFYRKRPGERKRLADGVGAISAVEVARRGGEK